MKMPSLLFFLALAGITAAAEPVLKLDLGSGATMDLVLVPAGQFTRGSPATEASRAADESQRSVRISRDYYIGRTSVTRGQWERFISETRHRTEAETGTSGGYGWDGQALSQRKDFTWKNPGFPQTAEHPVCLVTFPDAQAFCTWLERKSGRKVTLPTEAQWEYACRAGTTTPWHGASDDIAWHKGNSGNATHPVSSKPANPWGLFIAGNVSEWCLDWYAPYPAGDALDPRQDNSNLSDKPRRVLRGGSWIRGAGNTRSAARYRADPRSRNADIGFRIVAAVEVAAPAPPQREPELPPVEADDSRPAPAPPVQTHERSSHRVEPSPSRSGSPVAALFKGLICLALPVLLVVYIIRRATRSSSRPANDRVLQHPPSQRFTPPVRKSHDGFWVHGDWPEGTLLTLRYVVGGIARVQELIYRPGDDGQFVFTGADADSISIVAGSDPQDEVSRTIFSTPPPFPNRQRDNHDHDDDDRRRPPIFPSAY